MDFSDVKDPLARAYCYDPDAKVKFGWDDGGLYLILWDSFMDEPTPDDLNAFSDVEVYQSKLNNMLFSYGEIYDLKARLRVWDKNAVYSIADQIPGVDGKKILVSYTPSNRVNFPTPEVLNNISIKDAKSEKLRERLGEDTLSILTQTDLRLSNMEGKLPAKDKVELCARFGINV